MLHVETATAEAGSLGSQQRWSARLELGFASVGQRTVLAHRSHQGPLRVQKPFYPEDQVCHVYLLHPPGGMAAQDSLTYWIDLAPQSQALLTTPAAGKVYRSDGACSEVRQTLRVASGATLEWLPQETILYGGSVYAQHTELQMQRDSRVCFWDTWCLGRPAAGDSYATGTAQQTLRVTVDGVPVVVDRLAWRDADPLLQAAWGLSGHKVMAQMLLYPADADTHAQAQAVLAAHGTQPALWAGVTRIDNVLLLRVMGDTAWRVNALMRECWAALRQAVLGHPPCRPRIWAT